MSRALEIVTARAAEAAANRARYPITSQIVDETREIFGDGARLRWTDENGGRGTRGAEGVSPTVDRRVLKPVKIRRET